MTQVKLNTLKGLPYIIAAAMLREHGHYECILNGKLVEIIY